MRFKREAQVLASLNHPNIAAIYGLEESDGVSALVLELIEGPTLADRIARGPLPLDEALPIARQIADALETAHEQGIVHRDLKPANVKLRPDGTVKVLDFGLAKALQPLTAETSDMPAAPTITSPALTQLGVILGTAAYMSPEQAKGRPADKRSDVWAFGAVLYEMLSGQRAFKGDDISDVLAAVLRQDVDWAALPAALPASVHRLIARCLDRDPKRRLRDIGEARIALDGPFETLTSCATRSSPTRSPRAPARPHRSAERARDRRRVVVLDSPAGDVPERRTAVIHASRRAVTQPAKPWPCHRAVSRRAALGVHGQQPAVSSIASPRTMRIRSRVPKAFSRHPSRHFRRMAGPSRSLRPRDRTLRRIAVTGGNAVFICSIEPPYGISWSSNGIFVGQGAKGIVRVSRMAAHRRW